MKFLVVGTGPQFATPIERGVDTAVAAEAEMIAMRRLCGRFGRVEVWLAGRLLTDAKLARLVRDETASP